MFKTPLRAPPRLIELPAGFTYDAVSPTGTKLYLIEHLPPGGSDRYQVRSYDVTAGRLDEAVVVDKTVVAELMSGRATSRVSSSLDGAIVATLYERADAPPFIHVLYTEAVRAQCIDLPKTAHGQQWALVGLNGDRLRLQEVRSGAQAAVDLVTGRMHGLVEATPGASHS